MKRILPILLVLGCGVAHADGVPLFAGDKTALTQADKAGIQARMSAPVKNVVPVTVNRFAVDSNVITVEIEGKQYRFVGKKTDTGDGETWFGVAPGATLALSRSRLGVVGQIDLGTKMLNLAPYSGRTVLLEVTPRPLNEPKRVAK